MRRAGREGRQLRLLKRSASSSRVPLPPKNSGPVYLHDGFLDAAQCPEFVDRSSTRDEVSIVVHDDEASRNDLFILKGVCYPDATVLHFVGGEITAHENGCTAAPDA